jgi:hypothetical protein
MAGSLCVFYQCSLFFKRITLVQVCDSANKWTSVQLPFAQQAYGKLARVTVF